VIASADGDGFLRKVLPENGFRIEFDTGFILSSNRGFTLKGGDGLRTELPVSVSAGNVASIQGISLALEAEDTRLRGELSCVASVKLGPLQLTLERVGIVADISFQPSGGCLGPADLKLGFKPPNGAAVVIDAPSVTGGGFLSYDSATEQYAGAMQIEIAEIQLVAVGLLTTRMPDGSRGFSLIISITAEGFQPVQLGFGFRLSGVGGLIGVNRTVAVDVVRAGLKDHKLDAVLFPADPLRNITQILSNIRKVFPPAEGRFIFGPLFVIDWGTPALVKMDLAVIVELPSPVRLIVLGQLRAALPREDKALVRLNMDAIGVLEFEKGELAIDAVLYDSRVMAFSITGETAVRARWLSDPMFVMSAGGLNPHFKAPAGFPQLRRLAISLGNGKNPRLRLEAYLALTSNSAQVGARLDLRVAVSKFSIEGYLYFDTLFEFSPFQFTADMGAGVTLKWSGHTLLGVQLALTLSGPSRWHAKGKATFKIWIFSKTVSFDKTLGREEKPPVLPPSDPLPELLAALRDRRSWTGALPGRGGALVSLVESSTDGDLPVHPLGKLGVRQRIVPLDIDIARFGNSTPAGERRFRITQVRLGNTTVEQTSVLRDYFAPGQFLDLNQAERVSRPSFEQLQSGIEVVTDPVNFGGKTDPALMAVAGVEYETVTVSPGGGFAVPKSKADMAKPNVLAAAQTGAAARAASRQAGAAKYRFQLRTVVPEEPGYAVARTDDLTPVAEPRGVSYTAAAEALAARVRSDHRLRGQLKVVALHELAGGDR
jgi:hypothetical protein